MATSGLTAYGAGTLIALVNPAAPVTVQSGGTFSSSVNLTNSVTLNDGGNIAIGTPGTAAQVAWSSLAINQAAQPTTATFKLTNNTAASDELTVGSLSQTGTLTVVLNTTLLSTATPGTSIRS